MVYDNEWNEITNVNTEGDGKYTVGGIPPGTYYMGANGWGSFDGSWQRLYIEEYYNEASDRDSAQLITVTDATSGVDFTLEFGGSISGIITHQDTGDLIANANIQVYKDNWQHILGIQSKSDGSYTLGGLPTGSYYVEANGQVWVDPNWEWPYQREYYNESSDQNGAALVTVTIGAETQNINLTLENGGTISGHVYEEGTTTPIANVCVDVYASICHQGHYHGTQTDENGYYEIGGLPPGTNVYIQTDATCGGENYVIEWYGGDYNCNSAQPVAVGSVINFNLDAGGSISGHIENALGDPIINLHIYASDYNTNQWLVGSNTDEDGNYTLLGLPTGTYRLRTASHNTGLQFADEFYDNGYNWDSASPVNVAAPGDTPITDIILEVGNTISGSITGLAAGQHVHVRADSDSGTPGDWTDNLEFWTDINGSGSGSDAYTLNVIPAANYQIQFSPSEGVQAFYDGTTYGTYSWQEAVLQDLTESINNIDITLTPPNIIRGTISGLAQGQYVNIYAKNDNGTFSDGSDDFGFGTGINGSGSGTDDYSIYVAPDLIYTVEFGPDGGLFTHYKTGEPYGTWDWYDATRLDLTNDVGGIDITVQIDTDADELADDWENTYFGDLNQDGSGDFDEDGLNNLDEFRYGTIPNNPDSDGDKISDWYEIERRYRSQPGLRCTHDSHNRIHHQHPSARWNL